MQVNLTTIEPVLFVSAVLLLLSIFASKASFKFGIPSLVLFVLVGMLAGSEGLGGIQFDDAHAAHSLGMLALVLILFAGGLDTDWKDIRAVLLQGISLATVGVLITAGVVGAFAHFVLNFSPLDGLLLGAIVSSTDAAAVFGVLRAQKLRLKGKIAPLLELESGSNDPMAVFLTTAITGIAVGTHHGTALGLGTDLFLEMAIGALGGLAIGRAAVTVINRLHLDYGGLYPVFTLAIALLTYSGVQLVGGNGFLSVYVAGVTLSSKNFVHRISLLQFHDGIGWLMQIAMFLVLGLLVYPSQLVPGSWASVGLAMLLIFLARPLAVFASLLPFRSLSWQYKAFVSWVGLRGAVPIILATIPLTAGLPGAGRIFNCVFYVVLLSVIVQGVGLRRVAMALGVTSGEEETVTERKMATSVIEVKIPAGSHIIGRSVVELKLPPSTLLVLLMRGAESMTPRGNTVLQSGDVLLVHGQGTTIDEIRELFTQA